MSAVNKLLFKEVMAGNWVAVANICSKYPSARSAKLTRAKHGVLHLAVSEGDDNVVKRVLQAIGDEELPEILSLPNEDGDTPLHIAAALGLHRICWLLAEKGGEKVFDARNNARETALYIAAHHGKKKAFFVLQDFVTDANHAISLCRRGDGNTILHAAVQGEYFDLALEIINLYPKLVNFNNEMGQTALLLLANKPLVFKSGSKFQRTNKLIYACITVDPLKPKYVPNMYTRYENEWKKNYDQIEVPENYETCLNLYRGLRTICLLIVSCFGERSMKNCCIAIEEESSVAGENENAQHASASTDLESGRGRLGGNVMHGNDGM